LIEHHRSWKYGWQGDDAYSRQIIRGLDWEMACDQADKFLGLS
jgi:hypothetical protein